MALIPIRPLALWYADLLESLECISLDDAESWRNRYEVFCEKFRPKFQAATKKKSPDSPPGASQAGDGSQPSSTDPSRAPSPTAEADSDEYLTSLDPTEWKDQDHYRVLGLTHKRFLATDDDLKKQYRRKCLKHHPDKRGKLDLELDYFACIVKAYEQLSDISKRRAYDSVDPEFDESTPTATQATAAAKSFDKFRALFEPVFKRNSHFSNVQPVPELGSHDATKDEVEEFYKFWYEFDSWREFSYLDEEDKERGEDREERRYIEKNNQRKRKERKKEDTTRMRELVDLAFKNDPRIGAIKEAERREREEAKKRKALEIQQRREEEGRIAREAEEAERRKREAAEAELKSKRDADKREQDKVKKKLKEVTKALEKLLSENNYFVPEDEGGRVDPKEHLRVLEIYSKLTVLYKLENYQDLRSKLSSKNISYSDSRRIFREELFRVDKNLELEKQAQLEQVSNASKGSSNQNGDSSLSNEWPHEELMILIKSVNLFPAGTRDRWEVVAKYLNQHYRDVVIQTPGKQHPERTGKAAMSKAKELQELKPDIKQATNVAAVQSVSVNGTLSSRESRGGVPPAEAIPSQRVDAPQWTAEEQRLFEASLKQFSAKETDRWDKIADSVGTRTKKECMLRFKELKELVAAKKRAQVNK